jgi:protein FRG1
MHEERSTHLATYGSSFSVSKAMPVKPLTFKGDKKSSKKRKAATFLNDSDALPPSTPLTTTTTTIATTSRSNPTELAQEDDTWVTADSPTDLSGPVLLVLPTAPTPTGLACDDSGAVFASTLENLIEGDPTTAEPHDVRQVWVATQIPGNLGEGGDVMVSFKGLNGRYLGCHRGGFLRAESVAVGIQEAFKVSIPKIEEGEEGNGSLVVGTRMGKEDGEGQEDEERYLCVEEGSKKGWEIRGDGDGTKANTMLRIRMQARFKPRLKANKEMKAKEKISRRELEAAVGRRLEDEEVKRLKRARRNGTYHEEVLDVRVKGKHDKFAS